jgi:hypothetical protein
VQICPAAEQGYKVTEADECAAKGLAQEGVVQGYAEGQDEEEEKARETRAAVRGAANGAVFAAFCLFTIKNLRQS